jgi:hypothetical protein
VPHRTVKSRCRNLGVSGRIVGNSEGEWIREQEVGLAPLNFRMGRYSDGSG